MRTIRDEDRKRRDEEPVTIPGVTCVAATNAAILCAIGEEEKWIPQSQVHDDSEVYEKGHTGKLVILAWFARKEGLANE